MNEEIKKTPEELNPEELSAVTGGTFQNANRTQDDFIFLSPNDDDIFQPPDN